jgi:hypothetical protein
MHTARLYVQRETAHAGLQCAEMKKNGKKIAVNEKKFVSLQPIS